MELILKTLILSHFHSKPWLGLLDPYKFFRFGSLRPFLALCRYLDLEKFLTYPDSPASTPMKMALVMIKTAAMVSKALPGPGGALPRNISSPPEFQLLSRSCARKQTARFQVEKTFPTESLQNTQRCLAKFRHMMQLKARFYGTTVHIRSIKTIVNN